MSAESGESKPHDAPSVPGAPAEAASPQSWSAFFRELVRTWGPAVLAVLLIRTFIFEPYRIPSGSMVPTLLIGDHVIVSKFAYGIWLPFVHTELVDLKDPQRGDIIVFRYPKNERLTYIKRVVGIPGDHIRVRDNRVVLNGEEQPAEPTGGYEFVDDDCRATATQGYTETLSGVAHTILTNPVGGSFLADAREITVPPDHVFVMGDNRDHSEDSRRWGFVRYDQVKGKAHVVWFSLDPCGGQAPGEANAAPPSRGFRIGGRVRGDRWFHPLYGP